MMMKTEEEGVVVEIFFLHSDLHSLLFINIKNNDFKFIIIYNIISSISQYYILLPDLFGETDESGETGESGI